MKPRRPKRAPLEVTLKRESDGAISVHCSEASPSINQITSMVPLQRAREARRWVEAVSAACEAYGVRLPGPVSITATYWWPDRIRRDLWNYPPKWPVDGLVAGRLIPDDNAAVVTDCRIAFGYDPLRGRRLVLEVRSMDGWS